MPLNAMNTSVSTFTHDCCVRQHQYECLQLSASLVKSFSYYWCSYDVCTCQPSLTIVQIFWNILNNIQPLLFSNLCCCCLLQKIRIIHVKTSPNISLFDIWPLNLIWIWNERPEPARHCRHNNHKNISNQYWKPYIQAKLGRKEKKLNDRREASKKWLFIHEKIQGKWHT